MKRTTVTHNTMILAAIMLHIVEGREFKNKDKVQDMLQEMSHKGFIDAEEWEGALKKGEGVGDS